METMLGIQKQSKFKYIKVNGHKIEYGTLLADSTSVFCSHSGYIIANDINTAINDKRRLIKDIKKFLYDTSVQLFDNIQNDRIIMDLEVSKDLLTSNDKRRYFNIEMFFYFDDIIYVKDKDFQDKMYVLMSLLNEFLYENRNFRIYPHKK